MNLEIELRDTVHKFVGRLANSTTKEELKLSIRDVLNKHGREDFKFHLRFESNGRVVIERDE